MRYHLPRTSKVIIVLTVFFVAILPNISQAQDSNNSSSLGLRISNWWHRPMFSPGTISGMIYTRPVNAQTWQAQNPSRTLPYVYRPYGSPGTITGWASRNIVKPVSSYINKPFRSPGTVSGYMFGWKPQYQQQWLKSNPGKALPYAAKTPFSPGTMTGLVYNSKGASLNNNPVTRNIAFTKASWTRENIASPVKDYMDKPFRSPGTLSGITLGLKPEYAQAWKQENPRQDLPYVYKTPGDVGTITGIILPREKYIKQWQSEHPGKEVPYLWKPYFDVGTISGIAYTSPKLAQEWRIRHNGENPSYLWRPYFSSNEGISTVAKGRDFGTTVTGFLTNDILHKNANKQEIIRLNRGMEDLPYEKRTEYIINHRADYKRAGALAISLWRDPERGAEEMVIDRNVYNDNFPSQAEYYEGNLNQGFQQPDYIGTRTNILNKVERFAVKVNAPTSLAARFISPDARIEFMNHPSMPQINSDTLDTVISKIQSKHDSGAVVIKDVGQYADRLRTEMQNVLYAQGSFNDRNFSPEMNAAVAREVLGNDLHIPREPAFSPGIEVEPDAKFGSGITGNGNVISRIWFGFTDPKLNEPVPSRKFLGPDGAKVISSEAKDLTPQVIQKTIDKIDRDYAGNKINSVDEYQEILEQNLIKSSTNDFSGSTIVKDDKNGIIGMGLHVR